MCKLWRKWGEGEKARVKLRSVFVAYENPNRRAFAKMHGSVIPPDSQINAFDEKR